MLRFLALYKGLVPKIMRLGPGGAIMLLRNLDPPKLVNGTRLIIKKLMPHVIEATILCGSGEDVFIPRIPIIPSDLPFQFKRLQFPVRSCNAMSINKSQGKEKMYMIHMHIAMAFLTL